MMKNDINNQLLAIYEEYYKKFRKVKEEIGSSHALLMHCFEEYLNAGVKILFVGQETFGWGKELPTNASVSSVMKLYKDFQMGSDYTSSPFWRFLRTCYNHINNRSEDYPKAFGWTNFCKFDIDQSTPPEDVLQSQGWNGFELLKKEIGILKPDLIIFLTGWKYDKYIEETFPGIYSQSNCRNIFNERIYALSHPDFGSAKAIQCNHPNYLSRKKLFDETIEVICRYY